MYRKVAKIKRRLLIFPLVGVFMPKKWANAKIGTLLLSLFPTPQLLFKHLAARHYLTQGGNISDWKGQIFTSEMFSNFFADFLFG